MLRSGGREVGYIKNQVVHKADGEAALEYLMEREASGDPEAPPHFILLDLRLPKVDGLEVLEKIKGSDNLRRIPVVVLTTSQAEQDVSRAYELHANSYLVKPLEFDKFAQMIDDLSRYWGVWNYPPCNVDDD